MEVGKPEGNKPLGRPRHKWEDDMELHLRERGWGGMVWVHLAQDMNRWWTLVNTVMNLWVPSSVLDCRLLKKDSAPLI
jgi:hypothetical protein